MSNKTDCSTLANPQKGIELVYPLGGETFTLGSVISVTWKADPRKVESVTLAVSLNGSGGPWRNVFTGAMLVPGDTGAVCMDTMWIPGSEYDAVDYPVSGTVLLRLSSAADDRIREESGMISISR
jgi:hypothetical protein